MEFVFFLQMSKVTMTTARDHHRCSFSHPLFLLLILLEFLFYLDCVTFTIGCLPLEDGLIGDVLPVEDPLLQLVKAGVILELQPDSI